MIRLGHIDYSNCVPVHARLLERHSAGDVQLIMGVPSDLNDALSSGGIDVAPCSSIEYARHAAEYVVLPGLAIGSDGPVRSILLETEVAPESLDGRMVWLPTASATSTVLLRILLERRWGVKPEYAWFHQTDAGDPIGIHASAVLRIGDVALRRTAPTGRQVVDLGAAWREWTGLPFVFALWQARRDVPEAELRALHEVLLESLAWFEAHGAELASRHADRFGVDAAALLDYWQSLRFRLDSRMEEGLMRFFELAAEIGEAPAVETVDWLSPGGVARA